MGAVGECQVPGTVKHNRDAVCVPGGNDQSTILRVGSQDGAISSNLQTFIGWQFRDCHAACFDYAGAPLTIVPMFFGGAKRRLAMTDVSGMIK